MEGLATKKLKYRLDSSQRCLAMSSFLLSQVAHQKLSSYYLARQSIENLESTLASLGVQCGVWVSIRGCDKGGGSKYGEAGWVWRQGHILEGTEKKRREQWWIQERGFLKKLLCFFCIFLQGRREGRGRSRGAMMSTTSSHPLDEFGSLKSFMINMLRIYVCPAARRPISRHANQPTLGESKEHGERRRNCQPHSQHAKSCKRTVRDCTVLVQDTDAFYLYKQNG